MNVREGDFKPVLTKAALALQHKNNKANEFKALICESAKHESSTRKKDDDSKPISSHSEGEEFNIRKARHEVLKFAIDNQRQVKNKRKMEIFQLVKLGAKAPPKKYKNYKELKEERRRLKEVREQRRKFHQLGKNQTGAAAVRCRTKSKMEQQQKKRAPVTKIDAHYGKAQPKLSTNPKK